MVVSCTIRCGEQHILIWCSPHRIVGQLWAMGNSLKWRWKQSNIWLINCQIATWFLNAVWLKRCVSAQGSAFWGLERWVTTFGEMCDQPPPQKARIGNFKPKHTHIKIAVSQKLQVRSRQNLRTKLRATIALRGWSNIIQIKSNMAAGCHLKNRYDVITTLRVVRFWRNLAGWCRMTGQWRTLDRNRNRK